MEKIEQVSQMTTMSRQAKNSKTILILVVAAALLAVGVAIFWLSPGGGDLPQVDDNAQSLSLNAKSGAAEVRRAKGHRIREQHDTPRPGLREKPKLTDAMEDDEVAMTPAYKALLDEVRAAIDAEDRKRLIKVVQQMQDSDEWPDGIPASLNMAAVEALRWFGASVAPELVGYLGSSDPDVVESATAAMMDVLSDISLSDRERSSLLLGFVKVVGDADTLDSMMMELDNMRPTVRAKTGMAIFASGNKAASDALLENIEFLYCDMDDLEVTRPEDLKAYLKKAEQAYAADPDLAESDEDFYGGVKVE